LSLAEKPLLNNSQLVQLWHPPVRGHGVRSRLAQGAAHFVHRRGYAIWTDDESSEARRWSRTCAPLSSIVVHPMCIASVMPLSSNITKAMSGHLYELVWVGSSNVARIACKTRS